MDIIPTLTSQDLAYLATGQRVLAIQAEEAAKKEGNPDKRWKLEALALEYQALAKKVELMREMMRG